MSDSRIDISALYEFLRVRPAVDRRVALLEALNNPDVNDNVFALSGMIGVPVEYVRRDVSDLTQYVDGIEYDGDAVTITAPDQLSLLAEKAAGFLGACHRTLSPPFAITQVVYTGGPLIGQYRLLLI